MSIPQHKLREILYNSFLAIQWCKNHPSFICPIYVRFAARTRLSMKWIKPVILIAMASIALAFVAHRPPSDSQSVPADFTIVEYWEKWVGNEAAQMQVIVDDFNRTVGQKAKIHVRYMSMSNIDQKTLVAIAGGVPPDVAGLWDLQVAQYASLGAVQPLDDLAASHGITSAVYAPSYWDACHYQGHLYGLVSTPGTIALYYNKQIFQKSAAQLRAAGLDPNQPPATLDELDRYAAALDTKDSNGQLDRAGYIPLQSYYIAFTPYWFGDTIFNPQTHRFTLDSPAAIQSFQWIANYSKRIGFRSLTDFQTSLGNFDSPQNPFLVEKMAMQQQGPWFANYINHLKPSMSRVLVPKDQESTLPRRTDNYAWGVAPFPSAVPGLNGVTFSAFDILMIPTGARHKKEAFEFIAYVNRQDVCEKLNTLHCKNTQLRAVSPEFLRNHPNPYIDVFQTLARSPNAHGVPPVPIWPEVSKELMDASQAVAIEGADPAQTLRAVQARLQNKYDWFHALELQRAASSPQRQITQ
jgi:multiple sugar transport system substrate-binding protein